MTQDKVTIKTIDVHELKKQYDALPNLCLIDVREQDEWDECHIPRALHMPKDEIAELIEAKVPDKNQVIYLHCRSGMRSLHAANQLANLGYQQVYSVEGGIIEWNNAGYPVKA